MIADRRPQLLLLTATFIIAISGLIYELLAGTLSSYLLGDSVYQFSLVIGLFMSAMGIGAYLSRFIPKHLEQAFIYIQIALGVLGGLSAPFLFMTFTVMPNYDAFLFLTCLLIGSLVGLEIPLITRILEQHQILKLNISNVLTADYIGALVAALLFPLVLVPKLGLMNTSLLFGLMNLLVAGMSLWLFAELLPLKRLLSLLVSSILLLLVMMLFSTHWVSYFERQLFQHPVVFAQSTPYQRLVLTRKNQQTRLFINGSLQFNSQDEYRYHESLVHPVMNLSQRRQQVLILGGGDGLALREILKYADVEQVSLVDLDPAMTDLFQTHPLLRELHKEAFQDPRVKVFNQDAWQFVEASEQFFDVIIIDLPDPHGTSLSRLYSRQFYTLLSQRLSRNGLMVTQATSPLFAREAFWCIAETLASTPDSYRQDETLYTLPYHLYVPSFGEWGFVMAGHYQPQNEFKHLPADLRYFSAQRWPAMRDFPADMQDPDVEINDLHTHVLMAYYEEGWTRWFP